MVATIRLAGFLAACVLAVDANARERLLLDSFENTADCVAAPTDPRCESAVIATPQIPVAPGEVLSTCYYFRTPSAAIVGIDRLRANFAAPVQYVLLFATYDNTTGQPAERFPSGTVSTQACGLEGTVNNTSARRIWQAHVSGRSLEPPENDGAGAPIAIEWLANQPLFMQIVSVNATTDPAQAAVTLAADALPSGTAFTRTATYLTYKASMLLPPNSTTVVTSTCSVPPAVKFWHFTSYSRSRSTNVTLSTTPTVTTIVSSNDWQDPAIQEFRTAPFFDFGANQLRYSCTYFNTSGQSVSSGPDPVTDENCSAITYFFPATRPLLCVDNTGPL